MAEDTILGTTIDFTVLDVIAYGLTDTKWNAKSELVSQPIMAFLPKWIGRYVCPGTRIVAKNFAYAYTMTGLAIMEKSDEETLWFVSSPEPSHRIVELCAGLGGWSQGAEIVGGQVNLFVDNNPTIARTLARSLNIPCMNLQEVIEVAKTAVLPSTFVLEACIKEPWVWVVIGLMNIKHILASPPCPPWSTASEAKGLGCNDGQLLLEIVSNARQVNIESISLENVAGIVEHSHYTCIRKTIRELGWKIILAGVHPAEPMCPMYRSRWLVALIPQKVVLFDEKIQKANNMKMPYPAPGIGKNNSMLAADCVQDYFQPWELQELTPTQEAIHAMSRFDFLPPKQRTAENRSKGSSEIFMLRVKTMKMCLPTIMAMQGSQHCLPEHCLQRKGLFAFVVPFQNGFRYIAPFEVLCAMAFSKDMMLPRQFSDAWRAVGNALTVPQAAFHCFRLHTALAATSPFHTHASELADIMCSINRTRYQLQNFQVLVSNDGLYMYLDPVMNIPPAIKRPFEDCNEWPESFSSKKQCTVEMQEPLMKEDKEIIITPTVPYSLDISHDFPATEIDEQSETESLHVDAPVLELNWDDLVYHGASQDSFISTHAIKVGGLDDKTTFAMPIAITDAWEKGIIQEQYGTIPFTMTHVQHTWSFVGWVKPHTLLSEAIHQALPHAAREHFESIQVNGISVHYQYQFPECQSIQCIFEPKVVHRLICTKILAKPIVLRVDVTWQIRDMAAYLAAEAAILPSAVDLWAGQQRCQHDAYAFSVPETIFQARLTANTHEVPIEKVSVQQEIHDLQKDEAMKHPKPDTITVAYADPQWKKVMIFSMNQRDTVAMMKCRMFPGMAKTIYYNDGSPIPETETIGDMAKRSGDVDILFDYRQPLPCTSLAFARPFQYADECCDSKIEVQDPFSIHTTTVYVPQGATLTEVAARIVASYSTDLSVQITQNGKLIDPRVAVRQCPDHIFRLRATGLVGGAKANDDVTRALEAALTARGVPSEAVQGRITVILNKIPAKDIRPDIHLESEAFWTRLKFMANEAKVRLITSQELKEHQKKVRAEKKHSPAIVAKPRPKASPNASSKEGLKASELSIDVAHFEAGKITPPAIDFAKFGPDATGIAVATMEEANKMLPISTLSADPLALIVITNREFAGHKPTTIPAHHKDGTPILLSVVILNFGDIAVVFKPQVPMASINEIASTVLEINVVRKFVAIWGEVQSPMTFLGTHLPELRQGQVIATWQMHFFDEDRNKTGHQNAHHLHGFVRVATTLVDATLARSGAAGIFIAPKDANKKHHPNYAVIQMPGLDLEEAVTTAKKHKTALGVVQLAKSFAIRCRRTDLAQLRPILLPGSICPQEGEIQQDATLWMIKHLLTSTTCQELTAAMKSIGWQASVVKPLNNTTWIVSAQTPPPCAHVAINNAFVAIVPARKTDDRSTLAAFTAVPKRANVKVVGDININCDDDDMTSEPSTSTTRFSDLQKNLEQQLNQLIETCMQATDQRLNHLESTMTETKTEMAGMKDHINNANNAVMQQMQTLFGQLQTNIGGRLDSLEKEVAADADRSRSRHRDS